MDSPLSDAVILLKIGVASVVLTHGSAVVLGHVETPLVAPVRFAVANVLVLAIARSGLRICLREMRRRGYNVKRLVLISSPGLGDRLEKKIQKRSHYGYRIVRRFDYNSAEEDSGFLARVQDFFRSEEIDDAILALPAQANDLSARLAEEFESLGINVRVVPDLFPLIQGDTQIYDLDGIPLVNARLYPTESLRYVVFKRAFDLCLSIAALVLLLPLFGILAVIIKISSRGPVFFTQARVGMNGKKFRIIKLRTMYQAPSLDPDSHWTVDNDRYVTPLGRWLRRFNLDELPQFFNVLKGEMSLVGPRPERPHFLNQFRSEVPEYMARHYAKSGITGWAQVNGWRGDTAIPERVAHDLYYIRNWAMRFDIKILFLTLVRTFFQRDRRPGVLKP
jgi:Undecaprenyl-phosphate glucose phosphotransferase